MLPRGSPNAAVAVLHYGHFEVKFSSDLPYIVFDREKFLNIKKTRSIVREIKESNSLKSD